MTNAALRSEAIVAAAEIKGRSLWQNAWQRLLRNKAAVVSASSWASLRCWRSWRHC